MTSTLNNNPTDSTSGYSAGAVANAFLGFAEAASCSVSNMQLQKLVFLAHGYHLAFFERPLVKEHIRAWQWGPVIPQLYKKLQKFGPGDVLEKLSVPDHVEENTEPYELIKSVWNVYKDYSASQLSNLTHQPETPWTQTWENDRFGIIPNELIQAYYGNLVSTTEGG